MSAIGGTDLYQKHRGDTHRYALGIDVGGTKIAVGLVDTLKATVINVEKIATPQDSRSAQTLLLVSELAESVFMTAKSEGTPITCIGLGVPELVTLDGEIVSKHVVCWETEEVHATLSTIAPLSIFSDVQAAAIAEATFGAGTNFPLCLYVGIGTGISHTLVIDGHPYRGASGNAILFGSSVMSSICEKCGSIQESIVEKVSSGPGLVAAFNEVGGGAVTAEQVIAADASGDSAAMDVVKRAGNRVGEAIGNLINVLEPHIVVVGGGLGSNAVGSYWESLQSAARRVAWAPSMKDISIVHAIYGDMTGVLGAAISAAKAEKEKN
ncbi:MAG: hypothetical protein CMO98_00980 [Woeseia sp.]|nr:hypothetical protein [Woeseia sp.]|tara:strand:- start:604 stop:1575 length:972 start_codon:yes stop_codon:yes gene_type:complete